MNRFKFKHLWLLLAACGVWFAVFSGMEEILAGKFWKVGSAFLLGIICYFLIEIYLPFSEVANEKNIKNLIKSYKKK